MISPQHGNGVSPMQAESGSRRNIVISDKVALGILSALMATVIGSGWFLGPAKDRDLQDVKKDVAAHTAILTEISGKLGKLNDGMQEVRVDVARMQGSVPAPPVPAVQRTARRKPKAEKTEKSDSLLGGLFSGD